MQEGGLRGFFGFGFTFRFCIDCIPVSRKSITVGHGSRRRTFAHFLNSISFDTPRIPKLELMAMNNKY